MSILVFAVGVGTIVVVIFVVTAVVCTTAACSVGLSVDICDVANVCAVAVGDVVVVLGDVEIFISCDVSGTGLELLFCRSVDFVASAYEVLLS